MPFAAARGFQVFVEGATTLNTWEIQGAVATGGNLTFKNYQRIATTETSSITVHSGGQPLGLLVGGSVDLVGSATGSELQVDRGWFVVGGTVGQALLAFAAELHLVPGTITDDFTTPRVVSISNQTALPTSEAVKPGALDFASAFASLRTVSSRLGGLTPTSCPGTYAATLTYNWYGSHTITLKSGAVNVWNVSIATLNQIQSLSANVLPGGTTKLIINITDSGAVTLPDKSWSGLSNTPMASSIIWNYPHANVGDDSEHLSGFGARAERCGHDPQREHPRGRRRQVALVLGVVDRHRPLRHDAPVHRLTGQPSPAVSVR